MGEKGRVLSAVEVSPNARVSRRVFLSCSSSLIVFPNGSIAIAVLYHIGLVSVKLTPESVTDGYAQGMCS